MSITTTDTREAVYDCLPTAAEGWATAKAVAEVTGMTPSVVSRRLRALEEGGRVESSTDKAVTGARGKVWRQRAAQLRVVGPVEYVEPDPVLPAPYPEDEPGEMPLDPDDPGAYPGPDEDEGRDRRAAEEDLTLAYAILSTEEGEPDPDSRDCAQCGTTIPRDETIAGYTWCGDCDPDGNHTVGTDDDVPADVARAAQDRDAETPDPVPADRPIVLVASPVAGQPPQRAEVWQDDPNRPNVRVVYCHSRTSARVSRSRILGLAPAMSDDEANEAFDGPPLSMMVDEEDGDPSLISPAPTGGDVAAIVEAMAPAADPLTARDARALTDQIRLHVGTLLPLIKEAYQRRADLALGYDSWAEYCDAELRGLRMPLAERQAATAELRAEGLSTRAIAAALGTSDATARRDLAATTAAEGAPERVTGLDGRSHPASKPRTAAGAVATTAPADGAEDSSDRSVDAPAGDGGRPSVAVPGNPPAEVWVATMRGGIDYHRPAAALPGNVTACGRSMRTGYRLLLDTAEFLYRAKPCPRCWPEVPDQAVEDAALDTAEHARGAHTHKPAPAQPAMDSPAGPTAPPHDPRAGAVDGDSRPQDRPGAATTNPGEPLAPGADAPTGVAPTPALDGEVLPAPAQPDPAYVAAVAEAVRALTAAVGRLEDVLIRGPGGPLTLPDLKHERKRLDQLIRRLAEAA